MSTNSPAPTGAAPTGAVPTVIAVGEQVNGVAPNRKQEVQFSEAMDPATINAQSFQVTDSSGKAMLGTVSYDPDFEIASFLPNPALQTGATYTATITTAAASTGGMHLASPYTYTFTTRSTTDTSPLSVNSVSPTANATCVSATAPITITFDEAPDASTVNSTNIVVTGPGGAVIPVTMSINVTTTQVVLTPKFSSALGHHHRNGEEYRRFGRRHDGRALYLELLDGLQQRRRRNRWRQCSSELLDHDLFRCQSSMELPVETSWNGDRRSQRRRA